VTFFTPFSLVTVISNPGFKISSCWRLRSMSSWFRMVLLRTGSRWQIRFQQELVCTVVKSEAGSNNLKQTKKLVTSKQQQNKNTYLKMMTQSSTGRVLQSGSTRFAAERNERIWNILNTLSCKQRIN
jgi:hypothetical protein